MKKKKIRTVGCFAATKEFKKRVRKLFRFAICCNHATRFSRYLHD